jgi:phosphoribosylformylglycinamidine cyclo-ligase
MKYKDAGVDIDEKNNFIETIKSLANSTITDGVIAGIGGFGALFEIKDYKNPVLVSGTDGVGTKLKIAFMMNKHDTVGIDLVAMCVNDIITSGAKPIFFLDYFATGRLESKVALEVIKGIVEGCRIAQCALVGGETAELPSMYREGEYDLAGFAVGIVEKDKVIDGSRIREGDVIVGLKSSGLHSNGYSLVRKIFFESNKMSVDDFIPELNETLGEALLTPTRIYVNAVNALRNFDVKGIAHITGGGFIENIPRIFERGLSAKIKKGSWDIPPIFDLIKSIGRIDKREMFRTFNMGIGMILILPQEEVDDAISKLNEVGETPYIIGEIVKDYRGVIL